MDPSIVAAMQFTRQLNGYKDTVATLKGFLRKEKADKRKALTEKNKARTEKNEALTDEVAALERSDLVRM